MNAHNLLIVVRDFLQQEYATRDAMLNLLDRSGIDLDNLSLPSSLEADWQMALSECQIQGTDALESLMAEVFEAHPQLNAANRLLRILALGEEIEPAAEDGGGSLAQAVARDPLEGTDLLIAFAEARGCNKQVLVQLNRCQNVLLEIDEDRRLNGRMLAREKRWRKVLKEIIDIAHELEGSRTELPIAAGAGIEPGRSTLSR